MVNYLKAGKTEIPVRVSYRVLRRMSATPSDSEYGQTEKMLFYALENGAKFENVPFTMTMEDVVDLIDAHPEVLGQFTLIMEEQVGDITGKLTARPTEASGGAS